MDEAECLPYLPLALKSAHSTNEHGVREGQSSVGERCSAVFIETA